MSSFEVKKFSWLRTPSAWEQMQSWQQRRSAMRSDFESANDTLSTAFANASINAFQGLGTLAGQAALKRIQAAATAASKVDTTV